MNWITTADDETFSMDGTEQTKKYHGVVKTDRGQLGVRFLPNADNPTSLRIRLEPTSEANSALLAGVLPPGDNPTVPDGAQPRYSIVVPADTNLADALAPAVAALTHGAQFARFFKHDKLPAFEPAAVEPAGDLLLAAATTPPADKDGLIMKAKRLGIKGVNSRWGVAALTAAISKLEPAS